MTTLTDNDLAEFGIATTEPGNNGHARPHALYREDDVLGECEGEPSEVDVGRKRPRFHRITCRELDSTTYALDYLIDKTLVAGQPCIIAGGKKTLKTSLLIDMGLALAMGGYFLGKLPVERACRVGIMSGESGLATIQETARRICRAAGYNLGDVANLVFSDSIPRLDDPGHLVALRMFCEADELEVLAIDPTYLAMGGADAGNLFLQGAVLRGVSELCQEIGVTLVLVHHCRKGGKADPFSPPELEEVAWAGFQEWCRQWLLVGRRERYEPGTGVHRLWLSAGGSAGHSALWALNVDEGTFPDRRWDIDVVRASEAREDTERRQQERKAEARERRADDQLERDRNRLCQVMARCPDGETKTALRTLAGMGGDRFNATLATLLNDDFVVTCDVVKPDRNTPREGYKLADTDPPEGSSGPSGQNRPDTLVPTVGSSGPDNSPIRGCPDGRSTT